MSIFRIDSLIYFNAKNMKISKSLLQTIALAVAVGTTTNACKSSKEQVTPKKENVKSEKPIKHIPHDCPGCGMG